MHTEFAQFSIWNGIALCIAVFAFYHVVKAIGNAVDALSDETSFTPCIRDLEMQEKRRKEGR